MFDEKSQVPKALATLAVVSLLGVIGLYTDMKRRRAAAPPEPQGSTFRYVEPVPAHVSTEEATAKTPPEPTVPATPPPPRAATILGR